jgi:hypothetical protein
VDIAGVTSSATPSFASATNSAAVQLLQSQATTDAALFGASAGTRSDLASLTPAAVALQLYQVPGLLAGLTQWDGGLTPGSQRTPPAPPPAPVQPSFRFNPFDQSTWGANPQPSGSTVDTSV